VAAAASDRGSPGRRWPRITSTALITAGVVVLLDAAATLAWAEPVSALRAEFAQRAAAEELERLESEFAEPGDRFNRQRLPDLAGRLQRQAEVGDAIGRIEIPSIDADKVVIQGTDTDALREGPGHYPETVLPGRHGTVGIAGHRTTYGAPFRRIDEIERGDEIAVDMPYARFTYRFERSRIVEPTQTGVVREVGRDRLVLTACHPLYSASQRYVVFARLTEIRPP
jgi:sortase A